MSREKLEKIYNPASIERKWYNHWMGKDYFSADPKSEKEPYTIVIPPPNVTGMLTVGHVLNNTPVSILSVSKLIPTGMIFHFEHNNNYCTLPNGNKVQLILKDGLFFLPLITKYK